MKEELLLGKSDGKLEIRTRRMCYLKKREEIRRKGMRVKKQMYLVINEDKEKNNMCPRKRSCLKACNFVSWEGKMLFVKNKGKQEDVNIKATGKNEGNMNSFLWVKWKKNMQKWRKLRNNMALLGRTLIWKKKRKGKSWDQQRNKSMRRD